MSQETQNQFAAGSPHSAWEMARRAGFDMDLIEDSMELSPSERIRLHTLALVTAENLRRAMKERGDASALAASRK
jgi:hypothetical protein